MKVIIGQSLQVDPEDLKPDDDFEMNLHAAPTQVFLVFEELETEYGIAIPVDDRKKIKTVVRRRCKVSLPPSHPRR